MTKPTEPGKGTAPRSPLKLTDPGAASVLQPAPKAPKPAKPAAPARNAARPPAAPMTPTLPPQVPKAAWSARGYVTRGFLVLAVLIGGFGGWSVLTTISGAVVASGQVEVEQSRQVVQHPDGGVVEEIMVQNGDKVAAGTPLIRLDGTLLRSELAIVEGQLFEMMARRGRLEAEQIGRDTIIYPEELMQRAEHPEVAEQITGQQVLFEARRESLANETEQLTRRAAQIGNQIEGIESQQKALGEQYALIERELADVNQLLAKGLAQQGRALALEREAAGIAGSLGELTATRAESEGRITEIEIQSLNLENARREEAITQLRDLGYRELELAERRRSLAEQIMRLEIRAPVSGLIHAMQVTTPRSVLRAADPVLYIVPQDRPLVIAARIQPIHIDEVRVDQDVTLAFAAFDSRTTPTLFGKVSLLSADALTDEATNTTYYRAEIAVNEGQEDELAGLTLLPGMPVEVFIKTEDRSPLAYLVKPLALYFNRAFREN